MTKKLLFLSSLFLFAGMYAMGQDHLLLSEVSLAPDSGEFIEIFNPTATAISLDNYYLSDNSVEYGKTPSTVTNPGPNDFIAGFPPGFTIQPNQAMVIALRGDYFLGYYGVAP